MIDGINITLSIPPDRIRELLDFTGFHSETTGEILHHRKPTAEKFGLLFIIAGKISAVKVKGSVHKFANKGNHNSDPFTLSRFREVVSNLSHVISPLDQVHGIEIGVNIETSFDPSLLIRNLLAIRGQRFNLTDEPGKCYAESKFSQYVVKIYNKGLQYGLNQWVLRIEINYFKLARLFPGGLTWGQLSEPETWQYLGKVLLAMFEEVIYWDPGIDPTDMPERDKTALKDGHNPLYWEGLHRKDRPDRKRKVFQGLVTKYGSNFNGIPDMIRQEIDLLIDIPTPAILAQCYQFAGQENNISLSGSYENLAHCYPLLSCNNAPTSTETYPEVRKCLGTGIDISHQKIASKFLGETSIRWIFKTDRDLYLKLQNKYLTGKRKNDSLDIQFREICHQVRNQYFNPKNNLNRDIENINRKGPVLFDFMPYIDPVKLRRAKRGGPNFENIKYFQT